MWLFDMSNYIVTLIVSMVVCLSLFFIPSLVVNKKIKPIAVDFTYSLIVAFIGFLLLLVLEMKVSLTIWYEVGILVAWCFFMKKSGLRDLLND